jgi:hypothetical protein
MSFNNNVTRKVMDSRREEGGLSEGKDIFPKAGVDVELHS